MAKRYVPNGAFVWRNPKNGARYVWNPGYIHKDGLPGYPSLPKGLPKVVRASFRVIDDGTAEPVVEAATAAPGEKRTVTVKAPKKQTKTTTAKKKKTTT